MTESMQKEIDKRFLRGIAASPGIVIGKALIQYTLAVDRDNDLVNHLYEPLNPAVLRLIRNVIRVAKDAGKQVTVCGEMAGTPAYIPLLVGMGLTDLSMNPPALLEAKKTVRDMAFESWQSAARRACDLASSEEINRLIEHGNKSLHS